MSKTYRKSEIHTAFRQPQNLPQKKSEIAALQGFEELELIPRNFNRLQAFMHRYPSDYDDLSHSSFRMRLNRPKWSRDVLIFKNHDDLFEDEALV